jgi:hypothetical protein
LIGEKAWREAYIARAIRLTLGALAIGFAVGLVLFLVLPAFPDLPAPNYYTPPPVPGLQRKVFVCFVGSLSGCVVLTWALEAIRAILNEVK